MRIREMSDVHLEFAMMEITPLPNDDETILVVAGDLGVVSKPQRILSFLKQASQMFRAVIYVFGNHEFYLGGSLTHSREILKQLIKAEGLDNVHLLENETIVFDDVAFICATLWTDFDRGDPLTMIRAKQWMADYIASYVGDPAIPSTMQPMRPEHVLEAHYESKKFIFEEIVSQKRLGHKVVVVVHHGVTYKSVHPRYKNENLNGAFVSELSDPLFDANPDLVFHGHVHDAFDYYIDESRRKCETRVIANPRGYPNETNKNGFNETLFVDI